jgi:hypothetical protein
VNDRRLGGDLMLHGRDGSLGFRELCFRGDDCRLRFRSRGRCRCLGRAIDGEKGLPCRLVLEPLSLFFRRSFRGEARGRFGLETLLLFPLFPLPLLFGGSMDGLFLVHHLLEERLTRFFGAAPSRYDRAAVAFFRAHHDFGLGRFLRSGSFLVALEPDHALQLDGGVFLDRARGGLHADLELGLEELDGLRARLSEVPGQLVDSYLIH